MFLGFTLQTSYLWNKHTHSWQQNG